MEEENISMTQDCVEWNEDSQVDLRNYISNTPASSRKEKESGYSPGQEIDSIWKSLETKHPSPTSSTNALQRSHSYPLSNNPHRHRKRPRLVQTPKKNRKRRRPSSADADNHVSNEATASAKSGSLGFEDLLKQLDTPVKERQPLQVVTGQTASPRHKKQLQKAGINTGILPNARNRAPTAISNMPPPRAKTSSANSLPVRRKSATAAICYNRRQDMSGVAKAQSAPVKDNETSSDVQQSKQKLSIEMKTSVSKATCYEAATGQAPISKLTKFDFDENFEINESDFTALDMKISHSKKAPLDTKGTLPRSVPRKVTPTSFDLQQSKQNPSLAMRKSGSAGTLSITPIEQAPTVKSTTFDFDDDFEISESDLAALDAAIVATQVVSDVRDSSTLPREKKNNLVTDLSVKSSCKNNVDLKSINDVSKNHTQLHKKSSARAENNGNIQGLKVAKLFTGPIEEKDKKGDIDEFGDLPFDFEGLDKQIEKHTQKALLSDAVSKPSPDSRANDLFDDAFDEDFDFQALDNQIAQHSAQTKKAEVKRKVALSTITLPLPNDKVCNSRSLNHEKTQSSASFSRYQIITVRDDIASYTKALLVKSWTNEMMATEESRKDALHRPGAGNRNCVSIQSTEKEEYGDGWIFLRGEWYYTPAQPKDFIHLCSVSGKYQTDFEALPVILHTCAPSGSDEEDDLILVLHPDMLVPPTTISEAISCSRRAVLRSRLGSSGLNSTAALYGIMRHSLFELCMRENNFTPEFAEEMIFSIVRKASENLVSLGIKDKEARNEVIRVLPQLQKFHSGFMHSKGEGAKLNGNGIHNDMDFCVDSVEGAEEDLWSHELGLKGNLDVTVKATTQEIYPRGSKEEGKDKGVIGIELKTGHNQQPQSAHIAQLALYILMLSIRYGMGSHSGEHASQTGMLLYLNPQGLSANRVSPMINEWKSLIGQRNAIAYDIKNASGVRGVTISYDEENASPENSLTVSINEAPPTNLPDVLPATQQCNHCYVNRECMLYAASNTEESSKTTKLSHAKLISHFCGHLEQQDIQYFLDWDRLIDLEADATAKATSALWLTPSLELELKTGRTISSLVLEVPVSRFTSIGGDENSEWVPIILKRASGSESKTELSRLSVEQGSHVVISYDSTSLEASSGEQYRRNTKVIKKAMYLARGIVSFIDHQRVVVKVSKQHNRQLMHAYEKEQLRRNELKLRLDTDGVQTGLGTTKQNLVNLLTGDVKPFENSKADPKLAQNIIVRNRFAKLRETIVRLHPPQYDSNKLLEMFNDKLKTKIPGCEIKVLMQDFKLLNSDQKAAVEKVITANDYTLIQGLPGTGKTSTIVFVARLLAAHGKRVLITSYTHAAVDNIMIKLIDKGVGRPKNPKRILRSMVRIGKKGTTHPAVEPILLSEVALGMQKLIDEKSEKICETNMPSADAIHATVSNARIVGVTALSIPRSPILVPQKFDVVIIDEAGQISQPAILGALMAADKFVLVGDHKQLPPLVTSELAENAGYGISMLSRLAEKHPRCVAQLTLQYRMHEDICRICNEIAYGGKLRCANEKVKTSVLQLDRFQESKVTLDRWVSRIINPEMPVVFADTDFYEQDGNKGKSQQLHALESKAGKGGVGNMVNDREVILVKRMVHALLDSGLPASSIGVISPFRAQVRKLNDCTAIANWKKSGLEISTIDRYQGRDKEVIIVTFVRSNQQGYAGRLLNDFRRLNVAVSRAMKKLIMVGSYSTLHSGSTVMRPILEGLVLRKQVEVIPQHVLRSPIYE